MANTTTPKGEKVQTFAHKTRRTKGHHSGRRKLVVLGDVAPRDVTVQYFPDVPGRGASSKPEPMIEFRSKTSRHPIRIKVRALYKAALLQGGEMTFVPVFKEQGPSNHPELFQEKQ